MGYVYLLCDPMIDGYKIGVTRGSIQKRIKKLQTGNPTEIHMINYYETEYPFKLEKMLHVMFGPKRIKNEWFALDTSDISSFKTICEEFEKSVLYLVENNPYI